MSRLPTDGHASARPRAIQAIPGAMLGLTMLLLLHRNWGIDHDAALYLGQGLVLRWPEIFAHDLFFLHGDQGRYTLFPWFLAQTFDTIDPARLFLWGGLAGLLLFAAAAWYCLSALLPPVQRYWAWLGVLCLPSTYGTTEIFGYAEPFLTARPVAEAMGLLAIGLLVRGQRGFAFGTLALAALLHPLQAIAVALVVWSWLVMHDRRWLHAVWAAIPVVVLAAVGVDPFDGLFRQLDPVWMAELRAVNGQVFLTGWSDRNHMLLLFDALVLGYAWRTLRTPFASWCAAALLGLTLGLLGSLVLVDGLRLVLPAGLQLWRVSWLAHLFAMAAMAALVFRDVGTRSTPRVLLLTLSALLAWSAVNWLWLPFALVYAAWPRLSGTLRPRLSLALCSLFALGILLLLVQHVATELIGFQVAQYRLDLYAFDRRVLAFPVLALGLPLLGTWLWIQWPDKRMHLAGILMLCSLLAVTGVRWDARSPTARAIEAHAFQNDLFGVPLPKDAQVFWDSLGLVGPWLALQRADYFSPQQMSGLVFSRDTAMDAKKRLERLGPLLRDSGICRSDRLPLEQRLHCRISDESLYAACGPGADSGPDYLILPYRQPQPSLGSWGVTDPLTGAPIITFHLYRCTDIINGLADDGLATASSPAKTLNGGLCATVSGRFQEAICA